MKKHNWTIQSDRSIVFLNRPMLQVETFFQLERNCVNKYYCCSIDKIQENLQDFDKKLLEKFYVKGSKVIFKGFVKYFVSHKDH